MNAPAKTFGSPSGEPSTTRSMPQQMCEKLWTLPRVTCIAFENDSSYLGTEKDLQNASLSPSVLTGDLSKGTGRVAGESRNVSTADNSR